MSYKKSVADWAAKELAEAGELSDQKRCMHNYWSKHTVLTEIGKMYFLMEGNIISHSLSARGGSDKDKIQYFLKVST